MDADVVVIGAGAAGLAAARSLGARSLRTILLEARDRTGGRVFSRPSARAVVPAELGAEFIHGPAAETMALLRAAGTTAVDVGGEAWTFGDDRTLRPSDEDLMTAAAIFERARSLPGDVSVSELLKRIERESGTQGTAAARAFVEGFEAADPAIASARAIADEVRSGVDSLTARPIGGYPQIFGRLRSDCVASGVQIYLSTAVRRITWRRRAVALDVTNSAGEWRTIRARAAIVTLPVGVLRHSGDDGEVRFEPELPATKRAALAKIEMGLAIKVVLRFRTAFWESLCEGRYRDAGFFRSPGSPFSAYWTQLPVRSELVVAWAGGPKAAAFRDASQEQIVERALNGFGELFGETMLARDQLEDATMHDWTDDPCARGVYSYLAVDGGDARAVVASPLDETVFFAGEATSTNGQGGTVNGAFETGERAAREAAAALDGSGEGEER